MLKNFKRTFLGKLLDYNSREIEVLAENLYEKIRQTGQLANYVQRDKRVRQRFNVVDASTMPPVFIEDDRFTFECYYNGTELDVENNQVVDLGVVYQVEFEIIVEAGFAQISMFSDKLLIVPDGTFIFHGVTFNVPLEPDFLNKVKIIRNHVSVSFYVNEVLMDSGLMNSDDPTQFTILYKVTQPTPK